MNVRAVAVIWAFLVVGCSQSPVSPELLTGTWEGRYQQLSCTTTLIDRVCQSHGTGDVTLVLEQGRRQLSGEVTLRSSLGEFLVSKFDQSPFPVSGAVDGVKMTLTGRELAPRPNGGTRIADLQDWIAVPAAGGIFEGTATWTVRTSSKFGSSTTVRVLQVTGLTRSSQRN